MAKKNYGIASIGLHIPSLSMSVKELAKLRHVDPNKYTIGLGCSEISLCPKAYDIVDLAADAAERALSRWKGDVNKIGLISVGTESATDMSRPLSAWVAEKLNLRGAIRSYETKHACYGGTLAVRQALEWKLSGAAGDKAALIIAADISLYEEGDPGEPTEGAGAVAMIIDEPLIAQIDPISYPWSEPAFDFWRPEGEAFPRVDGDLSLECYKKATIACFQAMIGKEDPEKVLEQYAALCFHVPFPKMVKKAFFALGESFGWDERKIQTFFNERVDPTMEWNRHCGNAYTASLWIAVAKSLCGLKSGERITSFSYGSGFGAELLKLQAGPLAQKGDWAADMEKDLKNRTHITAKQYEDLRHR